MSYAPIPGIEFKICTRARTSNEVKISIKAGVNTKAVFWMGIMFLMQISRLRLKQSRISMLVSHIYVLGRFVNFW